MIYGEKFDPELVFSVVVCRSLLAVLCTETACRYFGWYRVTRNNGDTEILAELMLGIAIVQAGFLLFTVYALIFGKAPRHGLPLAIYLIGDVLITVGTIMHLRPALRIAQHHRVSFNIMIRAVAAVALAAGLLWFDLQ